MKKIKDENRVKTCQNANCGCSVRYIALGFAIFFFVIIAAVIFGN